MYLTGIEKIVEKIRNESLKNCAATVEQAKQEAANIIMQAKFDAAKEASLVVENGKAEAEKTLAIAKSSAETVTRMRYLQVKNAIVNDVIAAAYEKIESMESDEYFSLLLLLAEKNAETGEGVIFLSARDLERGPADFEESLNSLIYEKGALRLSKKPMNIENGFVLVYGDMEVNCTFRALFDEKLDLLRDVLCKELFAD